MMRVKNANFFSLPFWLLETHNNHSLPADPTVTAFSITLPEYSKSITAIIRETTITLISGKRVNNLFIPYAVLHSNKKT